MVAPNPIANRELLAFLVEHGLTMKELAKLLGVDPTTIRRWGSKSRLTQYDRLALLGLRISVLNVALLPPSIQRTDAQERECKKLQHLWSKELNLA